MSDASTDLITIPEDSIFTTLTTEGGLDEWINKVDALAREELKGLEYDGSTDEGRKELKRLAARVTSTKTGLKTIAEDLTRKQKKIPNIIIANKNAWIENLDALSAEIRKPADDWQAKEDERKDGHINAIAYLNNLADTSDLCSAGILGAITALNKVEITEELCEEFIGEYQIAFDGTKEALNSALEIRKNQEAEQAELDALRKEKAEREAVERAADEAAERERREKKIADDAAEAARLEAEQAARIEASRIAHEEATAKAEEEKRAADKEHRREVNNHVLDGLQDFAALNRQQAEVVVRNIVEGNIPYVSIRY